MTDTPERIWAWYDREYGVVVGSLIDKTHEPSVEYIRADLVPQWQPIETAPKDGTEFQSWFVSNNHPSKGIWEPRCRINDYGNLEVYCRIDYDEDGWDVFMGLYWSASHWKPLDAGPQPPTK